MGYGLSALTKPVFPLTATIGWVFAARFIDRIGKGIRGAPRDALVADITPFELRGAAYGLRQSLDSIGAFIGPLVAIAFMAWFANDIRAVLWIGIAPGFIAVALLFLGVREPVQFGASRMGKSRMYAGARQLPFRYWLIVILGALFTLARFSEAFLVLRARDVGLQLGWAPLVLIVMNAAYTATAYPAGVAADQGNQRTILMAGLGLLAVSDLVLAVATSPLLALTGAALWGIHMGLTQGLFAKLVADNAPSELLGTAFGIFNCISGIALLLASVIAGALWTAFGAPATFLAGTVFAVFTLFGLLAYR